MEEHLMNALMLSIPMTLTALVNWILQTYAKGWLAKVVEIWRSSAPAKDGQGPEHTGHTGSSSGESDHHAGSSPAP